MTQSKHTPGERIISCVRVSGVVGGSECKFLQVLAGDELVGLVPYSDRRPGDHAQSYADARLAAAAPDLLEAANGVREFVDDLPLEAQRPDVFQLRVRRLRAAIAKATGEEA